MLNGRVATKAAKPERSGINPTSLYKNVKLTTSLMAVLGKIQQY